ncbi:lysin B [Gordonia phage SCentae]|nr:lysin B [Gordonia phage SCentae]
MREIVLVAGAGERIDRTMLLYRLIEPFLRPDDKVVFLRYDNSIGPVNNTGNPTRPGLSLNESVRLCEQAIADYVRRTPHVPYILGYSLGAYGLSNFLENLKRGRYPRLEVAGAILVANPRARRRGRALLQGIAGAHLPFPSWFPIVELENFWDMICSTPYDSSLGSLPQVVSVLTGERFKTPREWWDWMRSVAHKARHPLTMDDYRLFNGYARGTAHNGDYLTDPVFRREARKLLG